MRGVDWAFSRKTGAYALVRMITSPATAFTGLQIQTQINHSLSEMRVAVSGERRGTRWAFSYMMISCFLQMVLATPPMIGHGLYTV